MAKSAQDFENEFIATVEEKTGSTLEGWMEHLNTTGLSKTKEITNHLKKEKGFNHLQATMMTGIFLNGGKPVYDYAVMTEKLFAGREDQRTLYQTLTSKIGEAIPEANLIPTKTYFSLDGEKCFGAVKVNKKNIRVGMDLGDMPYGDYVEKAKSLGAMPRISHMIEITEEAHINDELLSYLKQAYNQVHG